MSIGVASLGLVAKVPYRWTEVRQTILSTPEGEALGIRGNCVQAAVASALGLELDSVPHFLAFGDTHWLAAARLWLEARGLEWTRVPGPGIPMGRSVVIVTTTCPSGQKHAVTGDDGKIVWDPNPASLSRMKHGRLTPVRITGVHVSYVFRPLREATRETCPACGKEQGS